MLRKDPSFSIYNTSDGLGHEAGNDREEIEAEDLLESDLGCLVRSVTIGDNIEAVASSEFSFKKNSISLIEEGDDEKEEMEEGDNLNGFEELGFEKVARPASPSIYLATGLGINDGGIDGSSSYFTPTYFQNNSDVEEYYKTMLAQYPSNSLFLRNYGQILTKGDLLEAENCFFRAMLADPEDGETLLQYAELVWELHRDKERALNYFKQAVNAAPADSHVLAAYARFLWEIDEDPEESNAQNDAILKDDKVLSQQHQKIDLEQVDLLPSTGAVINVACFGDRLDSAKYEAAVSGEGGNMEEYSSNPLFLRNYADFLYQSKRDLPKAEEFYSRAILADPRDGEIMSQYANLVWELHHDKDKALQYFERAIQATPEDSHVLAAYACFLWEVEDEDECNTCIDHPVLQV